MLFSAYFLITFTVNFRSIDGETISFGYPTRLSYLQGFCFARGDLRVRAQHYVLRFRMRFAAAVAKERLSNDLCQVNNLMYCRVRVAIMILASVRPSVPSMLFGGIGMRHKHRPFAYGTQMVDCSG